MLASQQHVLTAVGISENSAQNNSGSLWELAEVSHNTDYLDGEKYFLMH